MSNPGMLYVTMQPQPGLSIDQFHEWYNNEHGPTRLRLPQIFANGLRYRATDGLAPHFLAVYDVTDMALLATPTYTRLREHRSPREAATIAQVDVRRSFLDLVAVQQAPAFTPIERLPDDEAEGLVLVAVNVALRGDLADVEAAVDAVIRWYEEEHFPLLARVPGWLRSRLYRVASPSAETEGGPAAVRLVSLHDYARANGLGGPEHQASMDTPRRTDVFARYIASKGRRTYELFYVFGPAPRDLDSLSRLPAAAAFASRDDGSGVTTTTTTTPGAATAAIESTFTTADGLVLPYRLEGHPSPRAPTVAFCNSLLTSLRMWDPLVALLRAARPDLRLLRYDHRGRHALPGAPPRPVTQEALADDLAALLDALRVPRLHALVGVSLGGASALRFALRHGGRLGRLIACDFNAASSAANTQAWKERVAVAEGADDEGADDENNPAAAAEGMPRGTGMAKLARQTVARWFHPRTLADKPEVARWVAEMVAGNDLEGFRYGCQALWDYDMREEMRRCGVPARLVVGEGDAKGALVRAMEGFRANLGGEGAELRIVPATGHLPMCESPRDFWEAIRDFL